MIPRAYTRNAIRPEMTVRQLAADFPAAQEVFRRHGERESPPARFGHLEPLTHFARRYSVPLQTLLAELAEATGLPVDRRSRFAQRIHHAFIAWGLLLTLTLGAGWGGWLLWQIGTQHQFTGPPAAYVVAHGEAQLWGFIVLFVMGISLRTVLQGVARRPVGPWISRGLLLLALLGIGGGLLWSLDPDRFASLGLLSGLALGLMSVLFWTLQILMLAPKWQATWARAVMMSGAWLTIWGAVTTWFRWSAGDAGPGSYSNEQRLLLIELAVFGFAMNSIYGFGQMLLPGLLRLGSTRERPIELAHWLHNVGTVVVCLSGVLASGGWGSVAGSLLLIGGAAMFALGHSGFVGRRRTSRRDEQGHPALDLYPPLAFFWLLTALVLMAGGAVFESARGQPLPHAYMGAVRHALTVGFMTTLILGVGQRLLPVLDRTVLGLPRLTVPILVLIGVGNLLRVTSELATISIPAAFRVMPFSAWLEWFALLLFAATAVATMFQRDSLLRRGRITRRSSVAVLLGEHPWIEDRLRSEGTGYLNRTRSVPEELTIGSFAQSEGLDAEPLISQINLWLAEGDPSRGLQDHSTPQNRTLV